jgi:hypothetical protein
MNPLRFTLVAIVLGAPLAYAQPSPVSGGGRVPTAETPAPRTRYVLDGRGQLERAGLIPAGYAYTFQGDKDGNTVHYTQLVFTAPGDEDLRALKLEYVAEVQATSVPGATPTFAGIFAAPAPLADSTVGRLVLDHAKDESKSMIYTLRGWKVTRTTRAGDEVSFLVLASHAKGGLGGKTYWVDDVTDSGWGGHWSLTRVDDPSKGMGLAHFLCSIRARTAPAQQAPSAGLAGALPGQ